ncbi:MAG TPA: FMN-dependent L-lactate dehydrogenase LldD [Woeseiaceae bacterium]|nr:FMN-dependent L-lactate dehydrogenase LldD [Woeseiaceae bacterium]
MLIASTTDFRAAAKRRLPPFLFEYIDGGAYAEITQAQNSIDLGRLALRQRVLTDVSEITLSTELFGQSYSLPIALGPVGLSGMYARRGEVQAAEAASRKGIPFCLSTVSVCGLEEVAAADVNALWFQLYVIRDRGFMIDLLARAKSVGCTALVFTVDMPMPGARYRDVHSGMSGPNAEIRRVGQSITHPRWAWDVGLLGRPHNLGNLAPVLGQSTGMKDYIGWLANNFDPTVTWADLAWIRDHWDGPLIIKGILDPDDAKEAVRMNADGIVVSNHGGRQLDGVRSTASMLPEISDVVGDALTVLVDGGVRSGLDVVRMLALGAQGVLLGRAWAYALGAAGGDGVFKLLSLMESEIRIAMALTGSTDVAKLDSRILAPAKML